MLSNAVFWICLLIFYFSLLKYTYHYNYRSRISLQVGTLAKSAGVQILIFPTVYHLRNIHLNVNSSEATTSGGLQQQTIQAILARRTCDDKRANKITKRIVNMIVKDMLPLSLADGEGFREVMGFIEPGYRIPSRKTL